MTKKLLITGAGVDRTKGIDFPLANTLLPDLSRYLENEGKEVEKILRSILPGLRFNFNKMIASAVDKIATREAHEQKAMVEQVQKMIDELPEDQKLIKQHGELIIRLFNKLAAIAKENYLDEEIEKLIRATFPKDADDFLDSESILDLHTLSLSDTFKIVLKRTLKMGLSGQDNPIASVLVSDLLNIETLLVEKFLGFYNEHQSDIKNYLYISWALWAFLVARQKQVFDRYKDGILPFYGKIPKDIHAITLNYTSFLSEHLGRERVIYFHGGLDEYVRMDTRNLLYIENLLNQNLVGFIKDIVSKNINLQSDDIRQQRHSIPALVPPLRLKPILSHNYIELWSKASQWVRDAEHVVVIGYSFNGADEHFNDILRCNAHRNIDVIVPEADTDYFKERMEKVFNIPKNQFDSVFIQGQQALQSSKLRLIPAKASDIDVAALFNNGR